MNSKTSLPDLSRRKFLGACCASVGATGMLSALGHTERAVLLFTTEVVRDVRASDEALAAVAGAGLSPREIVELLLVIGQYMMVARVAETAGIELDEPAAVSQAAERGRRT